MQFDAVATVNELLLNISARPSTFVKSVPVSFHGRLLYKSLHFYANLSNQFIVLIDVFHEVLFHHLYLCPANYYSYVANEYPKINSPFRVLRLCKKAP